MALGNSSRKGGALGSAGSAAPSTPTQTLHDFMVQACAGGTKAPGKIRSAIAQKMQDWVSSEINERLKAHGSNLRASGNAKYFSGGWRRVSVDVHIESPESGLVLALDPKHFQSLDSLGKNWKNGLNDLIALVANLHARFPLCVAGGIIGVEMSQISQEILDDMQEIIPRASGRAEPHEQEGRMEVCGLVVYSCGAGGPKFDVAVPPPKSSLRVETVFDTAVNQLLERHVA